VPVLKCSNTSWQTDNDGATPIEFVGISSSFANASDGQLGEPNDEQRIAIHLYWGALPCFGAGRMPKSDPTMITSNGVPPNPLRTQRPSRR
jgi:hypothetical protein